MFDFIPWKYICVFLLFRIYGPEITSEKFLHYSSLLSKEYCRDHIDKAQCVVEQINSFVTLANETYHAWFANLTVTIKEYLTNTSEKEKERREWYKEPSGDVEGNVSTAMSTLLDQMKKEYDNTLPGEAAKLVRQQLETITFDYQKTNAFCTADFGLDPSVIVRRIDHIAEMTKMPRHLQNILEQTVKVIDAGSSVAQNTPIAVDGIVHFILIAAYRNANNSFDIGMAVFSIDYKVSPKDYQYGDEEVLNKFLHFSKTPKVDDDGRLTFKGMEDLKAYFYGEAYKMFMHQCPSLLTQFKKVQKDIKSMN